VKPPPGGTRRKFVNMQSSWASMGFEKGPNTVRPWYNRTGAGPWACRAGRRPAGGHPSPSHPRPSLHSGLPSPQILFRIFIFDDIRKRSTVRIITISQRSTRWVCTLTIAFRTDCQSAEFYVLGGKTSFTSSGSIVVIFLAAPPIRWGSIFPRLRRWSSVVARGPGTGTRCGHGRTS